jgi:ferric-dicitrate binding protein FerR (iron transport regulator)
MAELTPEEIARVAEYLAGDTPASGRERIEHAMSETPGHAHLISRFAEARCTLRDQATRDEQALAPRAWAVAQAVIAEIQQKGETSPVASSPVASSRGEVERERSRRWIPMARTTAGIGVFLVASIVAVVLRNDGRFGEMRVKEQTYTTTAGQRAIVTLADGSRVQLGSATRVVVSARADGIEASVTGQALFTVSPHANRLFRVRVGHAVGEVLGTTFMTQHYATDAAARIVVIDGRVALSTSRGTTAHPGTQILSANMMGTVGDSGEVHVAPHIVADDYIGWTTGQLVFRDTPLRDAMIELGRVYGVEIRVTDSTLATRTLNAVIPVEKQSLAKVLSTIVDAIGAHPVRTGQVITLAPGRSPTRRPVDSSHLILSERQYGR